MPDLSPFVAQPAQSVPVEASEAALDPLEAEDSLPVEDEGPLTAQVPLAEAGARFDQVAALCFAQFSREKLKKWLTEGALQVDGRVVRPKDRCAGGEQLCLTVTQHTQTEAQPEPMALDIVHEDEAVIVINKPAGLVVHPGAGNWTGTLVNGLLHHDPRLALLPRAGLVHRIDKDTSGLLVVARSRAAMDALVALIAARQVRREYLALAHRPWSGAPAREIDAAIGRDPRQRLRMAVLDPARHPARPAQTRFELLQNAPQGCLLRCLLRTGRTHQIRVHLAHLGHPLVADALYGGAPAAGLTRQALHARRLAFRHPLTGQTLDFVAPLPTDLTHALSAWGLTMPADDMDPAASPAR